MARGEAGVPAVLSRVGLACSVEGAGAGGSAEIWQAWRENRVTTVPRRQTCQAAPAVALMEDGRRRRIAAGARCQRPEDEPNTVWKRGRSMAVWARQGVEKIGFGSENSERCASFAGLGSVCGLLIPHLHSAGPAVASGGTGHLFGLGGGLSSERLGESGLHQHLACRPVPRPHNI